MNRKLFFTLTIFFCFAAFSGCQKERRPSRFLIPDGYVGWIKVYFKVQNAPPLPIEDGYYLFKFPTSGVLLTSSDIEFGEALDQHFYYSAETRRPLKNTGWGGGGRIWAGYNGEGGNEKDWSFFQGFFVGTEAEYKEFGRHVDGAVPGPLDKEAIERKKERDGIE